MTPWWVVTLAWIGVVAIYLVVVTTINYLFWHRRKTRPTAEHHGSPCSTCNGTGWGEPAPIVRIENP